MRLLPSIRTSFSAMKTFGACERRWFFEKLHKIQTPSGSSTITHKGETYTSGTVFGGVQHEVLERWLNNQDPFPSGWDRDLQPLDVPVIQAMLEEAIHKSYIWRQPGQQTEAEVWGILIQGPTAYGPHVLVKGYVDWTRDTSIIDFKTAKTSRYLLKEGELSSDGQLLLYAKSGFDSAEASGQELTELTVGHLQFVRFPSPRVLPPITATVTLEQAEDNWRECQAVGQRMLDHAELPLSEWETAQPADPKAWKGVGDACNSYGRACPFLGVCMGERSLDAQLEIFQRAASEEPESTMSNSWLESLRNQQTPKVEPSGGGEDEDNAKAPTPEPEPEPEPKAKKPRGKVPKRFQSLAKWEICALLEEAEKATPCEAPPPPRHSGFVILRLDGTPPMDNARLLSHYTAIETTLAREAGITNVFDVRDAFSKNSSEIVDRILGEGITCVIVRRSGTTPDETALLHALETDDRCIGVAS